MKQPYQRNFIDCRGRHSIPIKSEKENDFLMSLCTKLGTKTPQQWRAAHGSAQHLRAWIGLYKLPEFKKKCAKSTVRLCHNFDTQVSSAEWGGGGE